MGSETLGCVGEQAGQAVREGLKPTSAYRRRSFQSMSGYVYLANTPERAKCFGDLGNGGRSVVYEVLVRIRRMKPDRDQLTNQRSVGAEVGNSIGESIVYGGGVRVNGKIEPWAIRRMTPTERLDAGNEQDSYPAP